MKNKFALLTLIAVLWVPVAVTAQDRERNQRDTRYEDKAHNDSHEWNDREDQAYRRYLQEHHKKYHNFDKAKKSEQADYWNWRHAHPE